MKFNIGSRIGSIREKRNLSQQKMAEILAMSPSAYSRLERNETQVGLDEIPRFAEVLNVTVQELLPEMFTVNNNPKFNSNGVVFCTNFYHFGNKNIHPNDIGVLISELEETILALKKEKGENL